MTPSAIISMLPATVNRRFIEAASVAAKPAEEKALELAKEVVESRNGSLDSLQVAKLIMTGARNR